MMNKKELRKYVAGLKTLHAASITQASADVLNRLEAHPVFQQAHTILIYHSLPDEVNTHDFIRKWSAHKQILLPVVIGDDLELRRYTGSADLKKGAYGIEEPVGEPFTDYDSIDLAIIPGVAFDTHGNRLGRGKGYYDRLLPRLPHTYKIGICFPFQLLEEIPTDALDVRMDEVLK